jgi:hypothetical protein
MLAICVKDAAESGSDEEAIRLAGERAKRFKAAVEQVTDRLEAEAEGWELPAGERPVFGPERPPPPSTGLNTIGGAPLDV